MIDWFWSLIVPAAILLVATVSTLFLYRRFTREMMASRQVREDKDRS